eukprot:gene52826-70624_t
MLVLAQRPSFSTVTELFKPITWFPPMWAFACGVVASGVAMQGKWLLAVVGVALAGPFVCATSQAVNDWFDRDVDAINEPNRPIPSGRMPGRWGLYIAVMWTVLTADEIPPENLEAFRAESKPGLNHAIIEILGGFMS